MNEKSMTTDRQEKAMEFVPFGAVDKIKLTIGIVQSIICIPTKTGKICTERDALRFMMLCQAQRLNPFAGDAFLCGYDGKNGPVFSLITAHAAFLKRAETCEDYEGMESGIIICNEETGLCTEREGDFKLATENCVGGWAKVYRKGRKPTYRRLSVAAMMPNYETPFWSEIKAPGQIVKCAETDALRATFPTLLGGLYSPEETNLQATVSEMLPAASLAFKPATQQQISEAVGETPLAETKKIRTPQEELELVIIEAGYDFTMLQKFGMESGNIANADSVSTFSEISSDDAKRLLRAKIGLLNSLQKIKCGS